MRTALFLLAPVLLLSASSCKDAGYECAVTFLANGEVVRSDTIEYTDDEASNGDAAAALCTAEATEMRMTGETHVACECKSK